MLSTTSILTQAKAVAGKQIFNLEIAARVIVVLIVISYGTLLDFLSGTNKTEARSGKCQLGNSCVSPKNLDFTVSNRR
ncbi:hypothetical protein NIES4073_22030 [Kalymmatonema gypsitolerans NIES-4073]|nr:hypothetical protein NIES4073_22030 [Scytonema sp. NIES-4073]